MLGGWQHPNTVHPCRSTRLLGSPLAGLLVRLRTVASACLLVLAGVDGTTPLGSLLQATLQRLIRGDSGLEALDHAAEAVLPLALADPRALQQAGDALLASCADSAAQVGTICMCLCLPLITVLVPVVDRRLAGLRWLVANV
jgi:hypothetical protein